MKLILPILFVTSLSGSSSSKDKDKAEGDIPDSELPPLDENPIDYKQTFLECSKQRELKESIRAICDHSGIDFYLGVRAPFDKEHLLPLVHIVPSHMKIFVNKKEDQRKHNLENYRLRNLKTKYPGKKFFKDNNRKFWLNTMWLPDDVKGYNNIKELTHGIDEDHVWSLDHTQDSKNLSATENPLLVHTEWSKNLRKQKFPKTYAEAIEAHPNFDDKKTETILYISTLNDQESGVLQKWKNPHYEKVWEQVKTLTEHYNVVIRYHPYDDSDYKDKAEFSKAIIMPEMHPIDIAQHADIIFGESSGATFAAMSNFFEKPWIYPCPERRYGDLKDKIVDPSMAVIAHESDDWMKKIEDAKKQVETDENKEKVKENRKKYYMNLQSSGGMFDVDEEYADYWTLLSFIDSLQVVDATHLQLKRDAIAKYNKMAKIPYKKVIRKSSVGKIACGSVWVILAILSMM